MFKKILKSLVLFLFLFSAAVAQDKKVTGKVTDENGNPISGASVSVKGSAAGVTTDAAGAQYWRQVYVAKRIVKVDGETVTLRTARNLMIVVSDNTATNLVLDAITADWVNAQMDKLGFKTLRSLRKIGGGGESKAFSDPSNKRADGNGYGIGSSTPREMVLLLEKAKLVVAKKIEVSKEFLLANFESQAANAQNQAAANAAAQFGAGATNQANLANAGFSQEAALTNAQNAIQNSQYNAGALNNMGQFNANLAQAAQAANQGSLNAGGQFNAGALNNMGQFNAANAQAANLANASNALQNSQFNAGNAIQNNQFNAGLLADTSRFNAGNRQAANLANAANMQQAGLFNAGALNNSGQFNAGNAQQANLFNAGALNAAALSNQDAALRAGLANQGAGISAAGLNLNAANSLGNLGNTQASIWNNGIENLLATGGYNQGLQQQQLDALYNEYLRRFN